MITTVKDVYKEKVLAAALECASVAFRISKEYIVGKSREANIIHARHAYCALVVHEFNSNIPKRCSNARIKYSDIGGYVNRDHASALYASQTSHMKNIHEWDANYISGYDNALKMFKDKIGLLGNPGKQKRLEEINMEMTKLVVERSTLLESKNKKP